MRDHKLISLESHLAHLPLFAGMAASDIEHIASCSKLIHAQKGDVLFRAGDACTGFHLLVFGQVKLAFTSSQGNEKIVEIIQQGQSFGEAIMFLDRTYIVFAQALQDSMLIHVPKEA
ncbi:MAG: cyclic nucleotide-binding domain-containing protein, partial [Dechloromonas agitata]|nr:cyclic nucleotide-binding domain-containing protein [Dechloromonas agitata]